MLICIPAYSSLPSRRPAVTTENTVAPRRAVGGSTPVQVAALGRKVAAVPQLGQRRRQRQPTACLQ